MRRREFVGLIGGAADWPLAARAQQALPIVGCLSARTAAADAVLMPGFRQALNARGFVEGRNVTIEYRYADLQLERLPALYRVFGDDYAGRNTCQVSNLQPSLAVF